MGDKTFKVTLELLSLILHTIAVSKDSYVITASAYSIFMLKKL